MKKTKTVKTALTLMLTCAALFTGCSTVAPLTTDQTTTPEDSAISTSDPETTPSQTVPTSSGNETVDPTVLSDLRVLVSSDVHCTDLQEWYGVKYRDRMQGWVDSVLKEHKEDPFDLVVIN